MRKHGKKLLKLGERIVSWRVRKSLTIDELALKAGISKGNLSDIENGKKDPRYMTLQGIAEGLGVKVATLLREL